MTACERAAREERPEGTGRGGAGGFDKCEAAKERKSDETDCLFGLKAINRKGIGNLSQTMRLAERPGLPKSYRRFLGDREARCPHSARVTKLVSS